jgi:hypothetical protein
MIGTAYALIRMELLLLILKKKLLSLAARHAAKCRPTFMLLGMACVPIRSKIEKTP